MNFNKLVNKVARVDAGQRTTLSLSQQSLLTVAQELAANALRGATDHRAGYKQVKQSLDALAAVTQLEYRP